MKNIWKYLLICIICFLVVGCDNNSQKEPEEIIYNVSLLIDDEIKEFIDFETEYEVKENESFNLPVVLSQTFNTFEETNSNGVFEYVMNENKLTIIGWTNNNELVKEESVVITKDTTFELKYRLDNSISKKTVKLTLNEGLIDELKINEDGILVLPTPTKENYDFVGWYTNPNFISSTVTEIDFNSFNKQFNVYAKFTLNPRYVNNLIESISNNPTIDDINLIEETQDLYGKVPLNKRNEITNYDKLTNLVSMLPKLYEAKEFYDLLNNLYNSEVSIHLKNQVKHLENLLETLDEELYSLMPSFDLTRFYEIVEEIDAILALYELDAKAFDLNVITIPIYMEQYYSDKIKGLYEEYQTYNEELKVLITTYDKLETLYNNLMEIEKSTDTIYYLNSGTISNVYTSKEQLCEAFFTDFYYYIVAYHGTEHLENNNLNNVVDFVELSQDFTGAGANNLYGIGNIAGRYMLTKDINGILENQSDNGFFGFCYKNGLYEDLLPFFINFFAYWRIDEGYANKSNYGADIFAESWAPTVDIAKFFYYDEFTSYVKTDRMIDCLTNTASVVYGLDEDPMNIRLRGYKFMGWYDNPEFNGSPVTDLNGHKKLYAKWVEDEKQQDEDAANLVDVYIYNLTTKKAVVNYTTVSYVKTMYEDLSANAKTLVKNYSTLQQYIKNNQ